MSNKNENVKIGKMILSNSIFNASGVHCTTLNELQDLDNNPLLGAVLTKTCTLNPRKGNEFPRYYSNEKISLNSTGLANLGIDFYSRQSFTKPYIVSISSISDDEEYIKLLQKLNVDNVNGIEINVSCPNIAGKPQLGYDFERFDLLLNRIGETDAAKNENKTIGLKLPPYMDKSHFESIAKIINKYNFIDFITCCNSIGNCIILNDDGDSVISPNNGLGGLGGEYIRPLSMGNVKIFKELLDSRISIIGCGGISNPEHVKQYKKLGATAVQIGTYLQENWDLIGFL